MPEKWQYNPVLDPVRTLRGCQLGLEVDNRCNFPLLCKFRIEKHLAPKEVHLSAMCPREREHEYEQAAVICRV